jgi:hypothetical protein
MSSVNQFLFLLDILDVPMEDKENGVVSFIIIYPGSGVFPDQGHKKLTFFINYILHITELLKTILSI